LARPRKIGADDSDMPIGPMGERDYRDYMRRIDLALSDVEDTADEAKTARSALQALYKDFKKNGGDPDVLRECMKMRRMDEGDLIAREETRKRYGSWMRLPLGHQTSMFGDGQPEAGTEEDAEEPEPHTAAKASEPPMTARSKRGPKGPKLVDNPSGSPLN
jgi:uncharacterized protein (UPF0335 family)